MKTRKKQKSGEEHIRLQSESEGPRDSLSRQFPICCWILYAQNCSVQQCKMTILLTTLSHENSFSETHKDDLSWENE